VGNDQIKCMPDAVDVSSQGSLSSNSSLHSDPFTCHVCSSVITLPSDVFYLQTQPPQGGGNCTGYMFPVIRGSFTNSKNSSRIVYAVSRNRSDASLSTTSS